MHKANPSLEFLPILEIGIMHDYLEQKKIPSKQSGVPDKENEPSGKKRGRNGNDVA